MNRADTLKRNPDLKWPRPTAQDRENYSRNIRRSKYFKNPNAFTKVGDRVRARFRIFDLPHQTRIRKDGTRVVLKSDWGWLTAPKGMEGTVVGKYGGWPTVTFDNGITSDVTNYEVELVTPKKAKKRG